eukprot:gene8290-1560_t
MKPNRRVKSGIDADEARRKREDNIIELRKSKRDEGLQKKRQTHATPDSAIEESNKVPQAPQQLLNELPAMVAGVYSANVQDQYEATQKFRKLLSIGHKGWGHEAKVKFEAAWALTNVASGTSDHTKVVIDKKAVPIFVPLLNSPSNSANSHHITIVTVVIDENAVPIFVQLLNSPSDDVREQAVWALGNIAGDSPKCRDYVLNFNALPPLLEQLVDGSKMSMLRNATWTLSNFCRGKPPPPFQLTRAALPTLARLITSQDDEVLTDSCWALSYLSDGDNDRIDKVIEAQVCPRLVDLLLHHSPAVLVPALRTVGNIVTGNDMQTQAVIGCGVLPRLLSLLMTNHKKSIKKEACWTISNITAGTKDQIQAVIDHNLIPPLISMLSTAEFDIKKEAAWAVSNATSGGTVEQISLLVETGCIKPLCELLAVNDARIVTVALEGLENILKLLVVKDAIIVTMSLEGPENILKVGETLKKMPGSSGLNPFVQLIEDAEGLDKIESLQDHPNEDLYEKAVHMLETYFDVDDGEDQNLAPQMDSSGQYAFGAPTAPSPAGSTFNFGDPAAAAAQAANAPGQATFNFGPQ